MHENSRHFHLFEVFGVELEYMLVNRDTLSVFPVADELIYAQTGNYNSDVENGSIAWSNELVLHVIELKTNGPVDSLHHLDSAFQKNIHQINSFLSRKKGRLLPGGMHPFMDPLTEAKIWPHEYNEVYDSYNRIFDCRGHGWSNLQSTHLNLPFYDDEEFAMLHAAIRILLPVIPAIAASSPIWGGNFTGFKDSRLEVYRHNQVKVPSVAGKIIPEPVYTKNDYEEKILHMIYKDISAYDSRKILQNEWINSRGAIPRFDRNTIEIRIIDNQECPQADLAIVTAITEVLKALVDERWMAMDKLFDWDENRLASIFLDTVRNAEDSLIRDTGYLECFGIHEEITAGKLWEKIIGEIMPNHEAASALQQIIHHGSLSTRILKAMAGNYTHRNLISIYKSLADCLERGEMFIP